ATVLSSTTVLFLALMESCWPSGERLTPRGWMGLLAGLAGVLLLMTPKLGRPDDLVQDKGPWLVLASAVGWAIGSFLVRVRGKPSDHIVTAAYQMIIGGGSLALIGVLLGEGNRVNPNSFTSTAVFAFFYLLVAGSLVGFSAYNWLLGNVSAPLAG